MLEVKGIPVSEIYTVLTGKKEYNEWSNYYKFIMKYDYKFIMK